MLVEPEPMVMAMEACEPPDQSEEWKEGKLCGVPGRYHRIEGMGLGGRRACVGIGFGGRSYSACRSVSFWTGPGNCVSIGERLRLQGQGLAVHSSVLGLLTGFSHRNP